MSPRLRNPGSPLPSTDTNESRELSGAGEVLLIIKYSFLISTAGEKVKLNLNSTFGNIRENVYSNKLFDLRSTKHNQNPKL